MTLWARAKDAAERTPATRNRYVDLLRATSIGAVVLGHWLLASPFFNNGQLEIETIFVIVPWAVWMTWGFQVMPVFFVVGGYSNAASWESARDNGQDYVAWFAARLSRLILPVVPLILVWSGLALIGRFTRVDPDLVSAGSIGALRPIWFLAVYIMIVVTTPITLWIWRHIGARAFWILILFAGIVDSAAFIGGYSGMRWLNYAFVWLAVSQLGYIWRGGYFARPQVTLSLSIVGLGVLALLVTIGGYPISMVSVPGAELSNSQPPTIALIALAVFQIGLLLSIEAPAKRLLRGIRLWAAVILVNRSIMTIYLWHSTAVVLTTGVLILLDGFGLSLEPGSLFWWITRPLWMILVSIVLVGLGLLFSPVERVAQSQKPPAIPAWQAFGGAALVSFGFARFALLGISGEGQLGFQLWVVLVILAGVGLILRPLGPYRPTA